MYFLYFSLSILLLIAGLLFLKHRRLVLMIVCLLAAIAPSVVAGRKVYKRQLRKELKRVSHLTFHGEQGFCDVAKWVCLRRKLKPSLHYLTEREEHLRLADIELQKPPLGDKFHELANNPPIWMVETVRNELGFFKKGRSNHQAFLNMLGDLKQLEDWQAELLLTRYKIKEGRLYVMDYSGNHNTLKYMNGALTRLMRSVQLPDMEFLVSLHDSLDLKDVPLPIFVHCKRTSNPYMIVIPDHESITGYDKLDKDIDEASVAIPWEEKEDLAFWRGSTTSGDYSLPIWRQYPRSKLVFAGLEHPEQIDAKFTNLVLGAEDNEELQAIPGIFAKFIYPKDHLKYRYLIDVDGNVSTYSRLYWILRSNCTALKHSSPYSMWFYPLLKAYVHYIPVKYNLSDLHEKVNWARAHPEKAKEIARKSTRLIREEVTTDHAYLYLYLVLKEYAQLFHEEES